VREAVEREGHCMCCTPPSYTTYATSKTILPDLMLKRTCRGDVLEVSEVVTNVVKVGI
jgi:hypothetical protein